MRTDEPSIVTPSTVKEYRWQDLKVGLKHEFKAIVTGEMMYSFLRITGDCNPLHVDAPYAQANGFRSRVVYGLLISSFYSTLVGVHLPGKFCLLHGIDVSFLSPVFVDDTLTIAGEVTYLNDTYRQAEIKAQITNESEKVVSRAKIRVGVLSKEDASS